jgi:L-ascorbate metabolism protein UlaG (beta-lactamase superfamily)
MARKAEIWYLGHSGFAVGIEDTLLVFDYYLDDSQGQPRCLATGVIEPAEIRDKKVLVFSSHRHPDHFNPVILSWREHIPHIQYFFSWDIPKKFHHLWIHFMKPYETYEEDGLSIKTFKSTDEGVAFLIAIKGMTLYHAGDLNWWHWEEEDKAWNNNMAARFKHEVELIKVHPIDVAILTTDPRQEEAELWGAKYFLSQVKVGTAFPMHFTDDPSIMKRIEAQKKTFPPLQPLNTIQHRGQRFTVEI